MLGWLFPGVNDARDRVLLAVWWLGLAALLLRGNTVFENWATMFVGLWSASLIFLFLVLTREPFSLPRGIGTLFFALVAVAVFSTVTTVNADASARELIRLGSMGVLLVATTAIFRAPEKWAWGVRALALLLGGIVVGSLALYLRQGPAAFTQPIRGPLFWHNQMGSLLLVSLPLFLAMGRVAAGAVALWTWNIAALTALVALVLTLSRGSWLVALGALPLSLVMLRVPQRSRRALLFSLVGVAVVGLSVPTLRALLTTRAESLAAEATAATRTTSGNVRLDAIAVARRTLRERFVLGSGPGTFADAAVHFQRAPWRYAAHAHNEILEMAAELGAAGGALITLFFLGAASLAWTAVRRSRATTTAQLPVVLQGALGIALLLSILRFLMDADWSYVALTTLFITLASLLAARAKRAEMTEQASPDRGVRRSRIFAGVLASVLLALTAYQALAFFYEGRATAAVTRADFPAADRVAAQWVRVHPKSPRARHIAAQMAFHVQDYRRTANILREEAGLAPWRGESRIALGEMREWIKDFPGAITAYEEALRVTPFLSPHPFTRLAILSQNRGETARSDELLREGITSRFPLNEDFDRQFYLLRYTVAGRLLRDLYHAHTRRLDATGRSEEAERVRARWRQFAALPPL